MLSNLFLSFKEMVSSFDFVGAFGLSLSIPTFEKIIPLNTRIPEALTLSDMGYHFPWPTQAQGGEGGL